MQISAELEHGQSSVGGTEEFGLSSSRLMVERIRTSRSVLCQVRGERLEDSHREGVGVSNHIIRGARGRRHNAMMLVHHFVKLPDDQRHRLQCTVQW